MLAINAREQLVTSETLLYIMFGRAVMQFVEKCCKFGDNPEVEIEQFVCACVCCHALHAMHG